MLSPMLHILARQDSMILHFNMVWLSWWVPSFSIGLFPKPKTGREFATFFCYQTLIFKSTISIHYHHCHFLVEFQLPLFFSLLFCPPASSFLSSCQVLILSLSIWLLAIFKFNCFQLRATTKDKSWCKRNPSTQSRIFHWEQLPWIIFRFGFRRVKFSWLIHPIWIAAIVVFWISYCQIGFSIPCLHQITFFALSLQQKKGQQK